MALADMLMLLRIFKGPTLSDVLIDFIIVAVSLWIAVVVGLIVGWSWKPRLANFTENLCFPSFLSVLGVGPLKPQLSDLVPSNSFNGLEEQALLKQPNISSIKLSCVEEAELINLKQLVEVKDGGPAWVSMMDRSTSTMSYQAWRRDVENRPTQYRSRTVFEDATPEMVRDFLCDDDFRFKWDEMLLHYNTLEECSITGTKIVQWVRKFPFLCGDREYVIGMRIWESDRTYYCVTKDVPYSSLPRRSKPRRVDVYYSSWCVRPAESLKGRQMTATEVLLFHHEDVGIPWEIAKVLVREDMWRAVKKIDLGLCAYDKELGFDTTLPKVSIIAMKGPPFTRKTEIASLIAASLGCPLLSFEHFLDELQHPLSKDREDEVFRVICRMSLYHLSRGVSKNVVIDSPLSSTWHLGQLTKVASLVSQARVVIVECKPVNIYLWRMKFEQHLAQCPPWPQEWYRPKKWEDVEKAVKINGDYDERSVEGHEFVSKMVVDPLLDHPVDDVVAKLSHSRISPQANRFVEAVRYMIERDKVDGPDIVVYHLWKQQSRRLSSSASPTQSDNNGNVESLDKRKYCSNNGHDIVVSKLERNTNCMACQKHITSSEAAAYSCKDCGLALHKECAESCKNNNTRWSPYPRFSFNPKYHFPAEFACNLCREMGKAFSSNCASCLFETHVKCRLMPTVIKHFDTEEHLLTIVLLPAALYREVYKCLVCGVSDRYNMYLCNICGLAYHYKCVILPRRVEHEHGGHHHRLSLKFSSEEAEDYVCHECQEYRDPALWFYSCKDCPYELHPSCVDQISPLIPLC